MSVLILDGHLKSALASVRSLGRAGVYVGCGSERKFGMACYSKYVAERFVYTSPKQDQKQFLEAVQKQAEEIFKTNGEKPVVLCFSDATMNTIVDAYETLKEFLILPFPPRESLLIARNKKETQMLAEELGVPTIRTFTIDEISSVTFPCIVKNQESIVWKEGVAVSGSASFVFDEGELQCLYRKIELETEQTPLIQEFVKGPEYGVEMLCRNGEVLATFVHKRVRSLSPRGGAAVVKETAPKNAQTEVMVRSARALVEKLLWTGPVMVEFKVNEEVLLMEINGRFWGSLPLAVKAGVDFPLIAYKLAQGQEVGKIHEAFSTPYVRTRHFLGDLKWIFAVLFASDRLRSYLYPSRMHAIFDFKKEVFISKGDVLDAHDLKPSLFEYLAILMK